MAAVQELAVVMKTLGDPTRLSVFQQIAREGDVTVGALVARSGVSQPAVSQHLRALRNAGLVAERRAGRHVHYRVRPTGLKPIVDWLEFYAEFWGRSLDNLEKLLEDTDG